MLPCWLPPACLQLLVEGQAFWKEPVVADSRAWSRAAGEAQPRLVAFPSYFKAHWHVGNRCLFFHVPLLCPTLLTFRDETRSGVFRVVQL